MANWLTKVDALPSKSYRRLFVLVVFVLGFGLYGNTLQNGYGLDDEYVTVTGQVDPDAVDQHIVTKGLAGLPEIFSSPLVQGLDQSFGYRPMVVASYALEYQLFGANPGVSHFINVLLYVLLCLLLWKVVTRLFPDHGRLLPALVVILFLIHPLHSEVVNNLKSRDELFCLIGGLAATYSLLRFIEKRHWKWILFMLLTIAFSLFSKKTGLAFLGVLPVVALFRAPKRWGIVLLAVAPAALAAMIFVLTKQGMVEGGARLHYFYENPLFFEGGFSDRLAMAGYSYGWYLQHLLLPYPLVSYYGFAVVPQVGWSDPLVWIGILLHLAMGIWAILNWKKRNPAALGIVIYIGVLIGYANLREPIVGGVADRFAFIPSVGFCIVLGMLLLALFKSNKLPAWSKLAVLVVLVGLSASQIWPRNAEWNNPIALYTADVEKAPESVKLHTLLASALSDYGSPYQEGRALLISRRNASESQVAAITAEQLEEAQQRVKEAVALMDSSYCRALRLWPDYAQAHSNLGVVIMDHSNNYDRAAFHFARSVELDTSFVQGWYNLGQCLRKQGKRDLAEKQLLRAIALDEDFKPAYDQLFELYFEERNLAALAELIQFGVGRGFWQAALYGQTINLLSQQDGISQSQLEAQVLALPATPAVWCKQFFEVESWQSDSAHLVQAAEKLLAIEPDQKAHYHLLSQFFIERQQFVISLNVNAAAFARFPQEHVFAVNAGDIHYHGFQDYAGAMQWFEKAWALRSQDGQLAVHIARVCAAVGDEANLRRFTEAARALGVDL